MARTPAQIDELAKYWREQIAAYVKLRRAQIGMTQKESKVRQTLSAIENANYNFSLKILLRVLEDVGGNISEAFNAAVPPLLRGDDWELHERLQRILATGDPEARKAVTRALKNAYRDFVSEKDPSSNQ